MDMGWLAMHVALPIQLLPIGEKTMKIKLINCDVCLLPYPKESITKRNKNNMCANCYVMTKLMYKPW